MDMTHPLPARVRILGEPIDLVTPAAVMGFTARRVAGRQKGLVLAHDAHSLALAHRNPALRAAYARADLVGPDSAALTAWGRLTGKPIRRGCRAGYLHWRDDFWRIAGQNGWRVLLLGGTPGAAHAAAHKLAARRPGLAIAAYDADGASLAALNAFHPDVVLLDMDAGDAAAWVAANFDDLAAGVVLAAAGAAQHEAGESPAAAQVDLPVLIDHLLAPISLLPSMGRDLLDAFEAREHRAASGIRIY